MFLEQLTLLVTTRTLVNAVMADNTERLPSLFVTGDSERSFV